MSWIEAIKSRCRRLVTSIDFGVGGAFQALDALHEQRHPRVLAEVTTTRVVWTAEEVR